MPSMWLEENKNDKDFMAMVTLMKEGTLCVDTLYALCFEGPLDDGHVPSKTDRDELLRGHYCAKISVGGEQGYNAATYRGNQLMCTYYDVNTLDEAKAERQFRAVMKRMKT